MRYCTTARISADGILECRILVSLVIGSQPPEPNWETEMTRRASRSFATALIASKARASSSPPSHSEQYVTMDSALCRRNVGVLRSVSRTRSGQGGLRLEEGLGQRGPEGGVLGAVDVHVLQVGVNGREVGVHHIEGAADCEGDFVSPPFSVLRFCPSLQVPPYKVKHKYTGIRWRRPFGLQSYKHAFRDCGKLQHRRHRGRASSLPRRHMSVNWIGRYCARIRDPQVVAILLQFLVIPFSSIPPHVSHGEQ